jgi:hypothetical protein
MAITREEIDEIAESVADKVAGRKTVRLLARMPGEIDFKVAATFPDAVKWAPGITLPGDFFAKNFAHALEKEQPGAETKIEED